MGEDTFDTCGAVVVSLASLTRLVTGKLFSTTVETLLEIPHVHCSRDGNIKSAETVSAHEQVLWGVSIDGYNELIRLGRLINLRDAVGREKYLIHLPLVA